MNSRELFNCNICTLQKFQLGLSRLWVRRSHPQPRAGTLHVVRFLLLACVGGPVLRWRRCRRFPWWISFFCCFEPRSAVTTNCTVLCKAVALWLRKHIMCNREVWMLQQGTPNTSTKDTHLTCTYLSRYNRSGSDEPTVNMCNWVLWCITNFLFLNTPGRSDSEPVKLWVLFRPKKSTNSWLFACRLVHTVVTQGDLRGTQRLKLCQFRRPAPSKTQQKKIPCDVNYNLLLWNLPRPPMMAAQKSRTMTPQQSRTERRAQADIQHVYMSRPNAI